jgi:hypothetical protein
MIHRRSKVLLAMVCGLACTAALPSAAGAVIVGIGDQAPAVFSDPRFLALHLTESRLIVPWDTALRGHGSDLKATSMWVSAAERGGTIPMISFGEDGPRIPTVAEYTTAVKGFVRRFPSVRRYTAFNEPDFPYTRLGHEPGLAAAFYNALVANCRGCEVIAGDMFMPVAQLRPYLRAYIRGLRYRPPGWGLHNYTDVRTHSTAQLRTMLSLTRGPIWLDETGGVERRGHWHYRNQSATAATRDEKFLFSLARRFPQISRIYHYQWQAAPWAHWDSALVAANGRLRPAYRVVALAAGGA